MTAVMTALEPGPWVVDVWGRPLFVGMPVKFEGSGEERSLRGIVRGFEHHPDRSGPGVCFYVAVEFYDGSTDRFALHRSADGAVMWRSADLTIAHRPGAAKRAWWALKRRG